MTDYSFRRNKELVNHWRLHDNSRTFKTNSRPSATKQFSNNDRKVDPTTKPARKLRSKQNQKVKPCFSDSDSDLGDTFSDFRTNKLFFTSDSLSDEALGIVSDGSSFQDFQSPSSSDFLYSSDELSNSSSDEIDRLLEEDSDLEFEKSTAALSAQQSVTSISHFDNSTPSMTVESSLIGLDNDTKTKLAPSEDESLMDCSEKMARDIFLEEEEFSKPHHGKQSNQPEKTKKNALKSTKTAAKTRAPPKNSQNTTEMLKTDKRQKQNSEGEIEMENPQTPRTSMSDNPDLTEISPTAIRSTTYVNESKEVTPIPAKENMREAIDSDSPPESIDSLINLTPQKPKEHVMAVKWILSDDEKPDQQKSEEESDIFVEKPRPAVPNTPALNLEKCPQQLPSDTKEKQEINEEKDEDEVNSEFAASSVVASQISSTSPPKAESIEANAEEKDDLNLEEEKDEENLEEEKDEENLEEENEEKKAKIEHFPGPLVPVEANEENEQQI